MPSESYALRLDKQRAEVTTEGSQTRITIPGLTAGPFAGGYEITLFQGSPLLNIAAVLTTPLDSLAILYDAGLVSQVPAWEKLYWADPEAFIQSAAVEEKAESRELAVKYRTIIGQSPNGSVAVFPPPHQYFYPLDNCYNLKHTWYGSNCF